MVTDIVDVMAKISKGINNNVSADEVAKSIKKEKIYKENIVAAAFSWVFEKKQREISSGQQGVWNKNNSSRFLSSEEMDSIGLKNYNHLLNLYNTGLINNNDFELIIDQIKVFPEDVISIDQINILILSLYLNVENVMPPGSR